MPREAIKFVFRYGTLIRPAVDRVVTLLREHGLPMNDLRRDEKPTTLKRWLSRVERDEWRHFNLMCDTFEIDAGSLPNKNLDFLDIRADDPPRVPWSAWADAFIGVDGFLQAWRYDCEYEYWQTAEDTLLYKSVGRDYSHLPMRSNGRPGSLAAKIIDTTANPGRWTFRDPGYIEAVGATMWLGETFWPLTGAKASKLKTLPWLRVTKPIPTVTCVQAAEKCFTSAGGIEADHQNALRRVLFPRGSGK